MDTVRIDRFSSRAHAELACSMLTAHGLNARVSGDDVGGVHPDIPYGIGGTVIVVPSDQLEEANALLDEEFAGALGDTDPEDTDPEDTDLDATDLDATDLDTGTEDDTAAGRLDAERRPDPDDGSWTATGRTAERRPGLRAFAVLAAIMMAAMFLLIAGSAARLWG